MSDTAPQIKYDVFVSFRGADIRDGFLSHLKEEFPRKQVNAFFDVKLVKGEEIWPSLVKAIEGSSISVIIFSKDYASSRWCLEELAKIFECREKYGQTVIPFFYNVEPADVRHQSGSYGKAFEKHETRYDLAQVQKWRDSLKKAANLSGIDSSIFPEEAEQLQEIIKTVNLELTRIDKHPVQSNGLFGIDESISHLESLLRHKSEDVRIIGVWGMGGIGKTTIADEVFKKLHSEYDGCCFLPNVREQLGRHGATFLKEKLFSEILAEDVKINIAKGLPNHIERRIGHMKVLIVLDDVNGLDQPEKLLGTPSCFGSGSRIIITTRDKQVLIANKVDDVHEIGKLQYSEALLLFCFTAFKDILEVDSEYFDLSDRVVNYAKGIPLVLKILGSLLHGKDEDVWESQLDKLKRMPNQEVHDKMRLSYDDLDSKDQEIFLDLACFFCGTNMKVGYIKTLLKDHEIDHSVSVGLERLKDNALITISESGYVYMDDFIKEMAWEIVRQKSRKEPGSYSGLWDPNDICEVLKNDKGTNAIKSIKMNFSRMKQLKLSPHIFAQMSKLQFLKFDFEEDINVFPQGIQYFPSELRYLSLRSSLLESLPEKFSAEKLVILDLSYSLVTTLWCGLKNLVNLKEVTLRYCKNLHELPDFDKAIKLEVLDVSHSSRLTSVHPSIFSRPRLRILDLFCCSSLTRLSSDNPSFYCSSLTRLSSDNPSFYCSYLTRLTSDSHLSSFHYLNVTSCSELKEFSVASKNIVELDLSRTSIKALSPSFGQQSELEVLVIKYSAIERLPFCTKNLTRLRDIDLYFCEELWILPELPPSLETLRAVDCILLRIVLFPLRATKQFRENRKKVEFWNCLTLDKRSLRAIELNAQINMMKFAYHYLSYLENNYAENYNDYNDDYGSYQAMYVYPGSSVPGWLEYKNPRTEDYIIIDLSSAPPSPPLGFIFCFILQEDSWIISDGTLQFNIVISDVENEGIMGNIAIYTSVSSNKFASDHVCVMYDQRCSHYLNDRAKNLLKFKIRATARFTSGVPKQDTLHWLVLKGYGVSLINTSAYDNFIQQMELRDQQNKLRLPSWMHNVD